MHWQSWRKQFFNERSYLEVLSLIQKLLCAFHFKSVPFKQFIWIFLRCTRNLVTLFLSIDTLKVKEEMTHEGKVSRLIIRSTQREDSGLFQCMATNEYGSAQRSIKLIVQEPPEIPKQFKTVTVSSRTVNVSWVPSYDGKSPITKYIVEFKAQEGQFWPQAYDLTSNVTQGIKFSDSWTSCEHYEMTSDLDQRWTQLTSLLPFTSYEMRLLAENGVGRSKPSEPVMVSTKEEVPEGPPTHIYATSNSSQSLYVTWKVSKPWLCFSGNLQHRTTNQFITQTALYT